MLICFKANPRSEIVSTLLSVYKLTVLERMLLKSGKVGTILNFHSTSI